MSIEDNIDVLKQHPRRSINRRKFLEGARCVLSLLRRERVFNGEPVEVSVVLGDDPFLRSLKKKYFGINHATDVVAFPQQEGQRATGNRQQGRNSVQNPEKVKNQCLTLLGDVVISLDRAWCQARDNGHSYSDEVLYLFIHGMLHLLGYRDAPVSEAARMLLKQNTILDEVKLKIKS